MRKLFATTALVALLSAPVMAQTETSGDMEAQTHLRLTDTATLDANAQGYLASNLMGLSVYTSEAEDAEAIGSVNDALIGEDGTVHAVIIGVGGFIGIGEKDVAVDFNRLTIVETGEGEFRVVSDASAEELEAAEPFERAEHDTMASDQQTDEDEMVEEDQTVTDATTEEPVAEEGTDQQMAEDTTEEPVTEEGAADQQMAEDATTEEPMTEEAVPQDQAASEEVMEDNPFANMTRVETGTIDTDNLIDAEVYSSENVYVGDVGNVVLTADGGVDVVVVDVGGFLGMGEKPVAVGFGEVEIYQDEDGYLYIATPFTEAQFDEVPAYEQEAYTEDRETMRLTPEG
ncbi:MAG: PRC-barrel domain-containing protein [Azospirillaceae bacterium]